MKINIDVIIENEYCGDCLYGCLLIGGSPCDTCKHGGGKISDKSYFQFDPDTVLDNADYDGEDDEWYEDDQENI